VDESTTEGQRPRLGETLWSAFKRFSRLWGFLLFLAVVIVLFRGIVLPFVFAGLIVYLLAPIVGRLEPKIGRVLAVILCYLVILGFLALFFGLLLPALLADLARARETFPATVAEFNDVWIPKAMQWVQDTFGAFLPKQTDVPPPHAAGAEIVMQQLPDGSYRLDLDGMRLRAEAQADGTWVLGAPNTPQPDSADSDLGNQVRELVSTRAEELTGFIGPAIQALIMGVAGFLTSFVLTFMIAAFILVDIERVKRFVRSLVPHESRPGFDELWRGMDKGLGGVVRGQLLICLVNGVLTFLGLVIFEVKYAILLGIMAGMFSLIPIFGTILSSIPIIAIAMVSGEHGMQIGPALGILAWIIGIHLLEANVLNPKIIGDTAHIHPVIVVFALLAGEHMYGLVGALLAIPVTSIVQTMFLHARRYSPEFSRDPER
jgi:predicted PurR-regulated permease PerM